MSRLLMIDLTFIFHFSFYFIVFCFSFIFLFLEQLGVRVYQSRCHISHKADHETWKNEVEGSRTK